jgi:hypothetical protein
MDEARFGTGQSGKAGKLAIFRKCAPVAVCEQTYQIGQDKNNAEPQIQD